MNRKQKGPLLWLAGRSRRFWIVCVLMLPVAYVASFGPACWYTTRPPHDTGIDLPEWLLIYWPIGYALHDWKCQSVADFLYWWAAFGAPPGRNIHIPTNPAGSLWLVTGSDR